MIQDKLKENHTYLVATNYWTPLDNKDDENKEDEEEANKLLSTSPNKREIKQMNETNSKKKRMKNKH